MADPVRQATTASEAHPDLLNPYLPDTDDLHIPSTPTASELSVERGGASLRGDIDWPESGPSSRPMTTPSSPSGVGGQSKLGPFGAKVVAAMTGATATSLLSKLFLIYLN